MYNRRTEWFIKTFSSQFTLLTVHRVHKVLYSVFKDGHIIIFRPLPAVVVDVMVGCLIYWSNKDENPFNQNNREQASVGDQNVITWSHNGVKKFENPIFLLKHHKIIELKIFWNHILKPVHDVKMAKPGQPCNNFCLLKKLFYFFFS